VAAGTHRGPWRNYFLNRPNPLQFANFEKIAPSALAESLPFHPLARMAPMAETQPGAQPAASFESSMDELEKVVKELEGGDLSLDRSLELFERGMSLSDICRKQLEQAETRVEMLIRKDGKTIAEPFRPEKS